MDGQELQTTITKRHKGASTVVPTVVLALIAASMVAWVTAVSLQGNVQQQSFTPLSDRVVRR